MITDLLFVILILAFSILGLRRPYIALSGVIWIDVVKPQLLSSSFLTDKPLSLLMTGIFFVSLLVNMNDIKAPKVKSPLMALVLLMLWISITTAKAHYPDLATFKYEVSIKTLIFTALIPFILDSRRKIECVIWVFITSVGFFIVMGGAKTLLGGGGYHMDIIQTRAINSGITETSTLSAMSVVLIPFICYLYRYSRVVQSNRYLKLYLLALSFAAALNMIGTYARTGLVAALALAVMMFYISKKKIMLLIVAVVMCLAIIPVLPGDWMSRMGTITDANKEESALGRLVVWRWTLDYAAKHPLFGGGFYAYNDNKEKLYLYTKANEKFETNEEGKAFHSIIFELLGEQGYAGLLIYLSFIIFSLRSLRPLRKTTDENLVWLSYLSKMIIVAALVYLAGGLFISIAFEPWLFYILLFGISLRNIPIEHPQG